MARWRVAVIGAGVAGSACAHRLTQHGCGVELFDKSRGVGGRMATRRAPWSPVQDKTETAWFDHGAPCWTAETEVFRHLLAQAAQAGVAAPWQPRIRADEAWTASFARSWVAQPDMPALCRWLTQGLPLHTVCTVGALAQRDGLWELEDGGVAVADGFDAVVVAIPPEQAIPLLKRHAVQWAAEAAGLAMDPCLTLMAITDEPPEHSEASGWDMRRLSSGPLTWVIRQDGKPGRTPHPGTARWVAHAQSDWAAAHQEWSPEALLSPMQDALADVLGAPQRWHHAVVHRWRYAQVAHPGPVVQGFRWNAAAGLGVCGDAWGGGGVEAAWLSGTELAEAMLEARQA